MVCLCICFPPQTTVTTTTGEKRMDNLCISDQVLTFSKSRQVQKWSPFYTWGHREPDRVAEFVVISASNGKVLQISGDHLLFVVGEDGKRVAKKAGAVCKGDKLYHLGKNGELETLEIVDIKLETFTGVFAPFTISGDFVANGFLVSCYAESDHQVAHAALAPLRMWYRLRQRNYSQNNSKYVEAAEKEGINGYVLKLIKIKDSLPVSFQKQICVS